MVAVASHDPEFLYSMEERRRMIRREISALPLIEGFVIRRLYGIGCEPAGYASIARELGYEIGDIRGAEAHAMLLLRVTLRHLR